MKRSRSSLGTLALYGVAGGILGTAAMALSQQLMTAASSRSDSTRNRRLKRAGRGIFQLAQAEPRSHEQSHSVSEGLVRDLFPDASDETRAVIGSAMHYGFGAAAGAAYAAGMEQLPSRAANVLAAGRGALYGALVWLVADEIVMPVITRWAPSPDETPARLHWYSLGSHLAYGMMLDWVVRRGRGRAQRVRARAPASSASRRRSASLATS